MNVLFWAMDNRVKVRVDGLLSERFMSIAARSGVRLYNVSRQSPKVIIAELRACDMRKLRTAVRKTKCRVVPFEKTGPYFTCKKVAARAMLPIGLLVCALALNMFFGRIWVISVEGSQAIPEAAIAEILRNHGLYPGAKSGGRNLRDIENAVMLDLDGLSFIGLRVSGVTLKVRVVESQKAPAIYKPGQRVDIVAACDAVVKEITPYAGTVMVKPGDTVRKGDTLIMGVEYDRAGKKDVCALGDVTGLTWHTGTGYGLLYGKKLVRTGESSEFRHFTTPWMCAIIEPGIFYGQYLEEFTASPILDGLFAGASLIRGVRYETETVTYPVPYEDARATAISAAYDDAAKGIVLGYPATDTRREVYVDVQNARVVARITVESERPIAVSNIP